MKVILGMFIGIFLVLSVMVYTSIPKNEAEIFENIGSGINPPKGDYSAEVVIIEFSDFQCPFCKRAVSIIDEIIEQYEGHVVFYYRNFPLTIHENSFSAAEAAECANDQGKFWEYHDILFENQNSLDKENLKLYAQGLGLEQSRFNDCFESRRFKSEIEKDIEEGKSLGITGTPTFFVNERKIVGSDEESIRRVIEEELRR